ncbi:hypothetical protein [Paenibacillus silviterrae]|uniref:hypothetical protein n=1 Tax=Paenibacillus silviterrae TaxID=3242194 RepID=UPI002542CBC9|nr:hypothetical protein [Paenibacillus chinjuensis]
MESDKKEGAGLSTGILPFVLTDAGQFRTRARKNAKPNCPYRSEERQSGRHCKSTAGVITPDMQD